MTQKTWVMDWNSLDGSWENVLDRVKFYLAFRHFEFQQIKQPWPSFPKLETSIVYAPYIPVEVINDRHDKR